MTQSPADLNTTFSQKSTIEMKIETTGAAAGNAAVAATSTREKGFWALNWLRFLLAIYLVFFHTLRFNYPPIEGTWFYSSLSLGNMATSVFFVLSGFLLTYAYVVVKDGRPINKRNFLVARFSTLYPLHFVCLLLAIGSVAVPLFALDGVPVRADTFGGTRIAAHWEVALALFMCFTLLNAWNPFYLVFNGPSWSLSALGFYYIVFPAIALKVYRMKWLRTALVLLGVLFFLPGLIADLLHRTDLFTEGLLHRNPIIRLPLFVAGIVLCVMFTRATPHGTVRQWILLSSLIIGTVVLATVLRHHESRLHIIENGMYYPASLAIIWLCASAKPRLHGRLRYWGDRLGAASLPMFLLHVPIYAIFRKVEQVTLVLPSTPGGISAVLAAAGQVKPSLLFYPLYLIVLVAICVFVQEQFVSRMQKTIRNRFSDRPGADASAKRGTRRQATGT